MTVSRVKKSFTNIPQTFKEVADFIKEIATAQRAINVAKKKAKKQIDAIKADLEKELLVLKNERDTYFNALFAFAKPRQAELTRDARSVALPTGTFGWRWTPPAVVFNTDKTEAEMVKYLEQKGLQQYVRVLKEVNREQLLKDKPKLKLISYEQREEFFAKPKLKRGEGSAEELRTEAIDVVKG